MTLRSSDLQSDSDLDSSRNSCDVYNSMTTLKFGGFWFGTGTIRPCHTLYSESYACRVHLRYFGRFLWHLVMHQIFANALRLNCNLYIAPCRTHLCFSAIYFAARLEHSSLLSEETMMKKICGKVFLLTRHL